jgi:uncharacterized protein (UPF0335 family)
MSEERGIGDNSQLGGIAGEALQRYIDRIEKLEEEKSVLAEDIKTVYAESKSTGFVPAIIRKLVAQRRKEKEDLREEAELLELYSRAIGFDIFE